MHHNTRLRFRLVVRNIANVTEAHIHLGRRGQNGPIVASLFGPSKFGISVRRGVVRGVLTSSDLVGRLQDKTILDLIREIERGNAYVNVHTVQNPDGEIRGNSIDNRLDKTLTSQTGSVLFHPLKTYKNPV